MTFLSLLKDYSMLNLIYPLKHINKKETMETEEQFASRISLEFEKRKSGSGLFKGSIFDGVCMYVCVSTIEARLASSFKYKQVLHPAGMNNNGNNGTKLQTCERTCERY